MRILGIESSADETSAAVVEDGTRLLSNVVASSLDLHSIYGGIVPEIAARSHMEAIMPTIEEALAVAGCSWDDIDAIAVTKGPGLIGSLLIGVMTARTLAMTKDKPLYAINHVEAHVYANFITETKLPNYRLPSSPPEFPSLALIVSGGHSQLVIFKGHGDYRLLGQTRDDAAGEAYDKVAKMLGFPYPGGPSIEKAARFGDPRAIDLPQAKLDSAYEFSFSGLKTAVLRASQALIGEDYTFPSSKLPERLNEAQKADIAASFERAALLALVAATAKAAGELKPKSIVIAGGVAASQSLRRELESKLPIAPTYTDMKLCTDNAAMIASLAYFRRNIDLPADAKSLSPESNLPM